MPLICSSFFPFRTHLVVCLLFPLTPLLNLTLPTPHPLDYRHTRQTLKHSKRVSSTRPSFHTHHSHGLLLQDVNQLSSPTHYVFILLRRSNFLAPLLFSPSCSNTCSKDQGRSALATTSPLPLHHPLSLISFHTSLLSLFISSTSHHYEQ